MISLTLKNKRHHTELEAIKRIDHLSISVRGEECGVAVVLSPEQTRELIAWLRKNCEPPIFGAPGA